MKALRGEQWNTLAFLRANEKANRWEGQSRERDRVRMRFCRKEVRRRNGRPHDATKYS